MLAAGGYNHHQYLPCFRFVCHCLSFEIFRITYHKTVMPPLAIFIRSPQKDTQIIDKDNVNFDQKIEDLKCSISAEVGLEKECIGEKFL